MCTYSKGQEKLEAGIGSSALSGGVDWLNYLESRESHPFPALPNVALPSIRGSGIPQVGGLLLLNPCSYLGDSGSRDPRREFAEVPARQNAE